MTSPTQGEHAQPKGTAADGKTELFNIPGYPLMVRAVDFNRLHALVATPAQPVASEDMRNAVRFAAGSAHWSEELVRFFGPNAREGINALEKQLQEALARVRDLEEGAAQPVAQQGAAYAELPKPDSYLFQHEDTGLTDYIDQQQVEWGFEENNPRWKKCEGVFSDSQMRDFADRTHALRTQQPAPAAAAAQVEPTYRIRTLNTPSVLWRTVPKHEYDAALAMPELFECEVVAPTPQADSQPAPQGETNAQLDTDSNSSAPGQQRDVAGTVALGQPVGHGSDSTAGDPRAQGDKLLTVAERNIRSFLRSAIFKSASDREATLNCVDVLWAAARAPADSGAAPAGGSRSLHPEKCPITGRPFFMTLDHPELGVVPTYGGPYDSYTIPAPEGEPTDPWHERELRSERYDHDAGWWVEGGEPVSLRIVHEDVLFKLQEDAESPTPPTQAADSVLENAARYCHLRDCNSGSLVVMQITGMGEDDWHVLTEEDADAAIDAARKQGGAA